MTNISFDTILEFCSPTSENSEGQPKERTIGPFSFSTLSNGELLVKGFIPFSILKNISEEIACKYDYNNLSSPILDIELMRFNHIYSIIGCSHDEYSQKYNTFLTEIVNEIISHGDIDDLYITEFSVIPSPSSLLKIFKCIEEYYSERS